MATYLTLLSKITLHFTRNVSKERLLLPTSAASALAFTAVLFKISFTVRDAPELFRGLPPDAMTFFRVLPLVGMARMLFLALVCGLTWVLRQGKKLKGKERRCEIMKSNSNLIHY